jgi:uncharacterized protein (DUF849 family)
MKTHTPSIILGQHVRVGNEDNLRNSKRRRITSVDQVKAAVELSERFGRKVVTAEESCETMKIRVAYRSCPRLEGRTQLEQ